MKTYRRDKLRRLVEAGKVVMAGSYHFDDMYGESRHKGDPIPCALMPQDRSTRKQGVCYMFDHDFNSGSGRAWINPDGSIHLYVHSNSSYDLRIID